MMPDSLPQPPDSDYPEITAQLERIQPQPGERFYQRMANAPWTNPLQERNRLMPRPLLWLVGAISFVVIGLVIVWLAPLPNPATAPPTFPIVILPAMSEWLLNDTAVQHYTIEVKASNFIEGEVGLLKSLTNEPYGVGFWSQQILADEYQGQRLIFSGYIRTENIEKWAGLWMRVEDEQGQLLSFDFMQSRPIHGTQPWTKTEVVLDIPNEGANVVFGILLDGPGQIWVKEVSMEIVDMTIATTNWGPPRPQPVGLDFESDIFAWGLTGLNPYDYAYATDTGVFYTGSQSGHLYSLIETPKDSGAIGQAVQAKLYINRQIRLSGYLKTSEVEKSAGLWLRVDDTEGRELSFDNMRGRPIVGTTDWQQYSVVIDVPPTSAVINFGVWLDGKGEVWADDFQIEIVEELTEQP